MDIKSILHKLSYIPGKFCLVINAPSEYNSDGTWSTLRARPQEKAEKQNR